MEGKGKALKKSKAIKKWDLIMAFFGLVRNI